MALHDFVGFIAAALVLATFSARTMVPLRALAVAINIAFVGYAYMAGLWPILLLHSIMLPLNLVRLREGLACRALLASTAVADARASWCVATAANDNRQGGLAEQPGAALHIAVTDSPSPAA